MNVTTIDFDIIMAPVIESYNDLIEKDKMLDNILDKYPYMNNMQGDLFIYEYLTRFIVQTIKEIDQSNVYFITSHEQIVDIINNTQDKIDLVNIDHHHDLGYDITNWNKKESNAYVGNWVKFLYDRNQINSYIWIGDEYSIMPDQDCLIGYSFFNVKEINLLNVIKKTDVLVICESPEWIPFHYTPLFQSWEGLCETWYNVKFDKR